ncbi:hypothetical protein QBC43DRAFT_353803 [Cladorrhinum sp. PSN259]|nr:hypothetical protein QBC43DRAFT_353803 [Cladorrhinum sp. PSN259]
MTMSAAKNIQTNLVLNANRGLPLKKWGWVIYRTTYCSSSFPHSQKWWDQFRARVERNSRESVACTDAPEIGESLEWVWVDNEPDALEGMSVEGLRERFRGWVRHQQQQQHEFGLEGPGVVEDPAAIPRFAFFVVVDEEALKSLEGGGDWERRGYVKFVDANWKKGFVVERRGVGSCEGRRRRGRCGGGGGGGGGGGRV